MILYFTQAMSGIKTVFWTAAHTPRAITTTHNEQKLMFFELFLVQFGS